MSRLRLLALPALAVAAALALPACSTDGSSGAAITVNGERITFNEFSDELRSYADADNQIALDQVTQQVAANDPTVSVEPTAVEDAALAAPVAAQIATNRVAYTLVEQELDELDVEVTTEQLDATREQLSESQTDPTTGQTAASPFSGLSAEFQDRLVRDTAAANALSAALAQDPAEVEVSDDEVAAALAAATEESCASVILTQTEDEALAALARVQGGEDFGAVASEVSLDQTSAAAGGSIGCVAEGETVAELDEALAGLEPGELAGPVGFASAGADGQPQDAFLVVRLDSRGLPSEEDVRAELEAQAQAAAASEDPLGAFIVDALAAADVEVDSRYGRWAPEGVLLPTGGTTGPAVVPPEGPATTTTSTAEVPGGGAVVVDPATGLPLEEAPAAGGG